MGATNRHPSRREKVWLRADAGAIVETYYDRGDVVHEGEVICRVTNSFESDAVEVTGLIASVLENPVVSPGNPLRHFARVDEMRSEIIEEQQSEG